MCFVNHRGFTSYFMSAIPQRVWSLLQENDVLFFATAFNEEAEFRADHL